MVATKIKMGLTYGLLVFGRLSCWTERALNGQCRCFLVQILHPTLSHDHRSRPFLASVRQFVEKIPGKPGKHAPLYIKRAVVI